MQDTSDHTGATKRRSYATDHDRFVARLRYLLGSDPVLWRQFDRFEDDATQEDW